MGLQGQLCVGQDEGDASNDKMFSSSSASPGCARSPDSCQPQELPQATQRPLLPVAEEQAGLCKCGVVSGYPQMPLPSSHPAALA